ncbi:hypothetical protein B2G69_03735 [Methylorubrum zatmanii]|nr:hypothetical protein [Methylorubrum zatmanii]ARO53354.1 hypothetical protein B2G69_03735 [Methylorubrum zatmanii]
MSGRSHIIFRPSDTLRDVCAVLREEQVEWLDGLTDADDEHDSRSETLRRVIDLARDFIESSIADDMPAPDDAFVPFNQPIRW